METATADAEVIELTHNNIKLDKENLKKLFDAWQQRPGRIKLSEKREIPTKMETCRSAIMQAFVQQKDKPLEQLVPDTIRVLDSLPLLPTPMMVSPMYLYLNNITSHVALDAIELLHFWIRLEKVFFDLGYGNAKDHQGAQEILRQILKQAGHTMGKLFLLPENEFLQAFNKENWYNAMNVIRIFEYTILDFIGVPKRRQTPWVTPDIYFLQWKPVLDPKINEEICSHIKRTLLTHIASSQLKDVADLKALSLEKSELTSAYDLSTITKPIIVTFRAVLGAVRVFCCFRKGCEKIETAPGQWKKCGQCGWARYCSRECQVAHWKEEHKKQCLTSDVLTDINKYRLVIAGDQDKAA